MKRLLIICFTLTICACTTQTAKQGGGSDAVTINQLINQLRQVEQQTFPEKNRRLLAVASRLLESNEYDWAHRAIQSINQSLLNDSEYVDYSLVASDIFMQRQQFSKANALLTDSRLNRLRDKLTLKNQQLLHLHRANLFSQLGNIEASINERVILSTILPPGQQEIENQEAIWASLTSLPIKRLQLLSTTTISIVQGWYQLALINKQYQNALDAQNNAIDQWIANNPNHPASYQLPTELQLIKQVINQRPKKVSLLLPMQGKLAKAGRAIRDGFFAAYYHAAKQGWNVPIVSVLDTSSATIGTVYDRAVGDGAELIIGPLSKDNVTSLQLRSQLPVTTLALNYLDDAQPNDNLFQFGLSLDVEAMQTAERAWLEGHRAALVIAPETNWGRRTAQVFIEKWETLGGELADYSKFSNQENYANVVKSALRIDKSQQRASLLKRLLGGNSFEFEPRRRADIDMIFLVARMEEARQLKPALNFYYASDIPVYSTSQIFSDTQQDFNRNDLNGIRFTTLPWTLDDSIPAKQSILDNLTIDDAYSRLYAMGADTFLLLFRLPQLQQIANTTLDGTTGQLRLAEGNRIIRKQPWAEIYRGEVRPLPTIITDYKQGSVEHLN